MNQSYFIRFSIFVGFILIFTQASCGEELSIDCYYESTLSTNSSRFDNSKGVRRICRSGYFQLPEDFQDNEEDLSQEEGQTRLSGGLCCPRGNEDERGR